jgi:hypothetical protein
MSLLSPVTFLDEERAKDPFIEPHKAIRARDLHIAGWMRAMVGDANSPIATAMRTMAQKLEGVGK